MTLAELWKLQGREEGIEHGIRLTALNMLKSEFNAEQVSNLTQLSIDEVENLRRQNFS